MSKKEAFYDSLKEKLENNTNFPSDYLYKFIVPTTKNQVEEVKAVFKNTSAVVSTKESRTGKFVSVSAMLKVNNADEVISKYYAVEKIEGLISL